MLFDFVREALFRLEVNQLLVSPSVQKISFTAEAVTVTGDDYRRLATKVLSGQVHFVVSNQDWDGASWNGPLVDPAVGAAYWYQIDTVQLLPGFSLTTPLNKATLLHELTHAVIDDKNLPASMGLHMTENESIAYIAHMLYRRYTRTLTADAFGLPQLQVADKIAENIANSSTRYTVTQDEIRRLRNTIGNRPIYRGTRGQLATSNGIG